MWTGWRQIAKKELKPGDERALGAAMDFIMEGLHQNFLITKMLVGTKVVYTDTVSHMMGQMEE